MANPEHVEIVKKGAEAVEAWRIANPETRLDLRCIRIHEVGTTALQGANLHGADLDRAHLDGADMRQTTLVEALLANARLRRARLSGARVGGASFRHAILTDADLKDSYCKSADFTSAKLGGATLRNATLYYASFTRTDLAGTDLSGAVLRGTTLTDTDLSGVLNLSSVVHRGPSSVGIDTLYRSCTNGLTPELEIFFRGCGVPDDMLDYAHSIAGAIQFYSAFISYSSKDAAFAHRLYDALQSRGIRCWLDDHQIKPGDVIADAIDQGIRLWDKVLLCCSRDSLNSWWVDQEIEKALAKERRLWNERQEKTLAIVPIDLDDYLSTDEWKSGKASMIKDRAPARMQGWDKDNDLFEKQLDRIVEALKTERPKPPQPKL